MAYAKHIIKRQVIELEIEKGVNSTDIQNRISGIYRDKIVPLLDKLFNAKSTSSPLVIDYLEIDIGEIPEDKLEAMFAEKFEAALQKNLAKIKPSATNTHVEIKHNKQQVQSGHSDKALVIYFLQTGLFPWWAQENNYNFLKQSFHAVIRQNNSAFKTSFINLLQDDEIIKRLAYNFSDDLQEAIAKYFFNISLDIIQPEKKELFSVFTDWYNLQGLQYYWQISVYKTVAAFTIHSEKNLFEKAVVLFIDFALQESNVAAALAHSSPNNNQIIFSEKINNLDNKFLTQTLKDRLQNKIRNDEYADKQTSAGDAFLTKAKNEAPTDDGSGKMNLQHKEPISKTSANKKHVMPVADLDKTYIQNAGLILLHPFLPRFFNNLGLTDDNHFISETAAERACLMLQYLAAGTAEDIFEAQLPLNKILCGIPLLRAVNVQFEITGDEKEIANQFLLAVIQNGGPGWKNLSVEGLQQAYLNREGIISARDGNWLLQVKREAFDILIDRLPWTIRTTKLPWMELLMFTEWQVL